MTSGNSVRFNEQIIHVCSFIWNDIYLECSQFLVWRKDLTVLIRALLKLIALKIYILIYDPFSGESAWQNIRIAMADHEGNFMFILPNFLWIEIQVFKLSSHSSTYPHTHTQTKLYIFNAQHKSLEKTHN